MIKVKHVLNVILVLTAVLSAISSCKKEEGSDFTNYISKEFVITYTTDNINIFLDAAAGTYPELADFKPYMTRPVDVYKLIYKTEIDGEEIDASGLVCIPSAAGEYPLLCFQNGTNTLNTLAPSEYIFNPAYQFVEIVASMGYAVVIPDYPGFGKSAGIPHPYLIREPTVRSITDMLYATREMDSEDDPEITINDDVFIMGYSQGGWATLSLHKALEQEYADDFNLKGSVCGAGPYDLNFLFNSITGSDSYPMPVYLCYIINSYSAYDQFTNPVSDILREPYASRLTGLYNGTLSFDQINSQLTTSVTELFTGGFLSGFATEEKYSTIRSSLAINSVAAWKTMVPLFLIHGGGDTSVNPLTTENMYNSMIQAGTSAEICTKEILPGLDHGDAVVSAMVKGLIFLKNLQ
jgi:pimeloyl-ACP methyl ester carboxylesterase